MVKASVLAGFTTSITMLFGKSPKVTLKCGNCGMVFNQRWNTEYIKRGKSLKAMCPKCNEVNDTNLYI